MNFQYDFSGNNVKFLVESEIFSVFKEHQKVTLKHPAYTARPGSEGTIVSSYFSVKLIDEATGEAVKSFTHSPEARAGLTYTIVDDEKSDTAKSDAMCENTDTTYNPDVAQVLQINYFGEGSAQTKSKFRIVVMYHAIRMDWTRVRDQSELYDKYQDDPDHPRYSPALMRNLMDRVSAIESVSANRKSLFGTNLDSDDILDEDTTGFAPENFVEYERHVVNTSSGIVLVQPSKGSFYPNGLKIITYVPEDWTMTPENVSSKLGKLFIYTDDDIVLDN